MKRYRVAVAIICFCMGSTIQAQQVIISGDAAQAAIFGASVEQGRQFAQDQRAMRDRAALAEQQAFYQAHMSQLAAKEAQMAAGEAAWANMNAEARRRSVQAVLNTKSKHIHRAETIKKVQEKRKQKSAALKESPKPAAGAAQK